MFDTRRETATAPAKAPGCTAPITLADITALADGSFIRPTGSVRSTSSEAAAAVSQR